MPLDSTVEPRYTNSYCIVIVINWSDVHGALLLLFRKQSVCSSRRMKNLTGSWTQSGQSGCRRCVVRAVLVVAALSSTRDTCLKLVPVSWTRGFISTLCLRQKYNYLHLTALAFAYHFSGSFPSKPGLPCFHLIFSIQTSLPEILTRQAKMLHIVPDIISYSVVT